MKNNSTDLAHVHQLIDGCKLSKGRAHPNQGIEPLSLALFSNISASNLAYSILELTARTEKAVPPFNVPHPESVAAELAVAGVRDYSYHEVTGVNLTLAEDEAITAVESYSESAFTTLNNGWITWKVQGLYGSNYLARAFTFAGGAEFLVTTEAIYPTHDPDQVSLASNEAYLYTFTSKPPLGITGFWSMTLYNATDYLLPNPENIFAVGDRSNLTYPDGSLVYGNSGCSSEGIFQVLIQSAGVPPPSNWSHK